jgi:hypothetical protein
MAKAKITILATSAKKTSVLFTVVFILRENLKKGFYE